MEPILPNCWPSMSLNIIVQIITYLWASFPAGRTVLWIQSHKLRNKLTQILHDNGRNTLKVIHWNAGGIRWENKTDRIKHFIADHNPDIACITEANLDYKVEDYETVIPGYIIVKPNTMDNLRYCRILLLIKEHVNYKIETEFMDNQTASIWIQHT